MATTGVVVLLLLGTLSLCYGGDDSGYSSGKQYGISCKDVFEFDLSGRYAGGRYGAGYGRGEQYGSGYKGGNGNEGHDNCNRGYDGGYGNKDGRSEYSSKEGDQYNSGGYGKREYNNNGYGKNYGEKRDYNTNNNGNGNKSSEKRYHDEYNNNGHGKSGDQGKYGNGRQYNDVYGYGSGDQYKNGHGMGRGRGNYGDGKQGNGNGYGYEDVQKSNTMTNYKQAP